MPPIVVYSRDFCGYSTRAMALLEEKGAVFEERNASRDPSFRAEMMQRSGRNTFPQIFIGETHVGGCDDLFALDRSGGLDPLLKA